MGNKESIYKLLIADDEYWIRDEISGMLDWEKYDIEFLEPACDGEDAYKKIEENTPDILITDVEMPFLNGVDLVKKVKAKYPDMVIIMLSGYNDFDYVKNSLLAGALDYILKPVSKMDLVKVMTKALEIINNNILKKQEREVERSRLLRAASSLNDREYSQLVTKNKPENIGFIQATGLTIPEGGFSLMLVKIHGINSLANVFNYDMNLLSFSIKQRIEDIKELKTLFVFNNIYSTSEFILVVDEKKQVLKEKAYYLLVALKEFTNLTISIGISDIYFSEMELSKAYSDSKKAYMMRPFSDGSVVNLYEDVMKSVKQEEVLGAEIEKRFTTYLSGNSSKLKDFIMEDIGLAKVKEGWTLYRVDKTVRFIIYMINKSAIMDDETGLEIENLKNMLLHAVENIDYEEMLSLLNLLIDNFLDHESSGPNSFSNQKTSRQIISEIVRYIDAHYFDQLSLSMLADNYHMESTYLSKLFKKEVGQNLVSYISKKRIEKACELMHQDNVSLTEVAFLVGYDDYTYFNKVFKKDKGMSPREFLSQL